MKNKLTKKQIDKYKQAKKDKKIKTVFYFEDEKYEFKKEEKTNE